jgi:hypothetical protein
MRDENWRHPSLLPRMFGKAVWKEKSVDDLLTTMNKSVVDLHMEYIQAELKNLDCAVNKSRLRWAAWLFFLQ